VITSTHPPLPFGPEVVQELETLLSGLGLELCHIGWVPGKRRGVLTLFIDRPGGVSLDDCERASHAADEKLDTLEDFGTPYVLEVSSPGLDRPLWKLKDCERFCGSRVRIQLLTPVEGTARLKGVLESVSGSQLTVLDEDRQRRYTVQFGDVKVARLIPEF
jgi:ribosome maturation factor RimP